MTGDARRGFAARPRDPDAWVRAPETVAASARPNRADFFSARLTLDVTPAMRARIKLAAFAKHQTVADMLRALLDAQFPDPADHDSGTTP